MAKSNELIFSVGRENRSLVLCANFISGYTTDFKLTLPEAFRDALDIKLTDRVFGGKNSKLFTQGSNYSFKDGDVIYDSKEAYELEWGEALKSLKICLRIKKASDAYAEVNETYETINSEVPLKHTKTDEDEKEETKEKVIINKYKYFPGSVEFIVLRPNATKTKMIEVEKYESTQEDFVVLLQSGVLRTKDKKEVIIIQ